MRAFKDEFSEWLKPLVIGTLDFDEGAWETQHSTVGFNESMSGSMIWTANRTQVAFTNRVFLPIEDEDGDTIVLDSTLYIVFKEDYNFNEDEDEIIYQVRDRQPFDYYQYALVEAVDI